MMPLALLASAPALSPWFSALREQQGLSQHRHGNRGAFDSFDSVVSSTPEIPWPADISFERLLDEFVAPANLDKTVINIGANDGKRHDPSYSLLASRQYGGLMFEGDANFRKRLVRNMRAVNGSGRVRISWGFASPANIAAQIRAGMAEIGAAGGDQALQPDAFKIDIDSFDLPITRSMLAAGIRPKVIVVEINPDIPPPMQWTVEYDERFMFDFDGTAMRGFYGASLDAWHALMQRNDYGLAACELGTAASKTAEHNAWFVRGDLMRAAGVEVADWRSMNNAYWRQIFSWQRHFPAAAGPSETPRCLTIGGSTYGAGLDSHYDRRPVGPPIPCPFTLLAAAAEGLRANGTSAARRSRENWRAWAHMSALLASPRGAASARRLGEAVMGHVKRVACTTLGFRGARQDPRICPDSLKFHMFHPSVSSEHAVR